MNLLIKIIIIIILVLFIYLYYKNIYFIKSLEKFDSALSTYFQYKVDSDDLMNDSNVFNKQISVDNNKNAGWDGVWEDNAHQNVYVQFIQNNDSLIITISNSAFDDISVSGFDANNCSDNLFSGIGVLNYDKTIFILKEIICSRYVNPNMTLTVNNFSGYLNKNSGTDGSTVTLYSNNNVGQNIVLTRKHEFTSESTLFRNYKYGSNYINSNDPYISATKSIPESSFKYIDNFCPSGYYPCIDTSSGIDVVGYKDTPYNACGTPDASTGNCTNGPNNKGFCMIEGSVNQCQKTVQTYDYMNFMPLNVLTKTIGNTLQICDYLSYFNNSNCNSVILCYVKNFGDVKTLNSQFGKNVTSQKDIMYNILNTKLLKGYRDIITNNIVNDTAYKAVSLTNCLENNKLPDKSSNMVTSCLNTSKTYISEYKPDINIIDSVPALWQINAEQDKNITNSCTFTLSTSNLYNTQPKYITSKNDGTLSLTLFKGGNDKKFILEGANILYNKINASNQTTFVAISANIRAFNKLYMLPTSDNSGLFNNSKLVKLSSKPEANGKWIIIGMSLNNLLDVSNNINSISFI